MTRAHMRRFKKVLEAELAAAAQRLTQSRHQLSADKCADALEETCSNAERDLAFASLSRDSDAMRDIRAALLRIEERTFGVCLSCGDAIGPKRLEAVPWSPFCIRCQEAADRDGMDALGVHREVRANAA